MLEEKEEDKKGEKEGAEGADVTMPVVRRKKSATCLHWRQTKKSPSTVNIIVGKYCKNGMPWLPYLPIVHVLSWGVAISD